MPGFAITCIESASSVSSSSGSPVLGALEAGQESIAVGSITTSIPSLGSSFDFIQMGVGVSDSGASLNSYRAAIRMGVGVRLSGSSLGCQFILDVGLLKDSGFSWKYGGEEEGADIGMDLSKAPSSKPRTSFHFGTDLTLLRAMMLHERGWLRSKTTASERFGWRDEMARDVSRQAEQQKRSWATTVANTMRCNRNHVRALHGKRK